MHYAALTQTKRCIICMRKNCRQPSRWFFTSLALPTYPCHRLNLELILLHRNLTSILHSGAVLACFGCFVALKWIRWFSYRSVISLSVLEFRCHKKVSIRWLFCRLRNSIYLFFTGILVKQKQLELPMLYRRFSLSREYNSRFN